MAGIASTILLTLFAALGIGVWIAPALLLVGMVALFVFRNMPVMNLLSISIWNTLTSPELLSLPLFVLMGEILFRADPTGALLRGVAPWAERLPGKLLHTNVIASTLFAAVSGSSAATTATVGRITLAELERLGYDRKLLIGSLAGAGTLGFLIPPSIIMIVYGVLAQTSILDLFAAGIIPGLLLATCFVIYLATVATLRPEVVPVAEKKPNWADLLNGLRLMGPILVLMIAVLGAMYTGVASPTEAAALGVLVSCGICAVQKTLTWSNLKAAALGAVRTTSMLGLIVVAAGFLSTAMGYLGLPRAVAQAVAEMNLGPYEVLFVLLLIYLILGCFLDGVSMIVTTLPITLPLVTNAGYDSVWFGIFLVLVVEMAQLTPPIGFNLFVIEGITGESIWKIAWYTLPFFLIMVLFTVVTIFVPGLVTFFPALVAG